MHEYINLKEAAGILGYKSPDSVRYLINQGSLVNAKKIEGKWLVSKAEVESFLNMSNNKDYLTLKEAQKKLGYKTPSSIKKLIEDGSLINSKKFKGQWLISKVEIDALLNNILSINEEYITIKEAQTTLGYKAAASVLRLIENGLLKHYKKVKGKWLFSKAEIELYLKELNDKKYVNLKEAAEILNRTPAQLACLYKKEKIFPNALIKNYWKIPIVDIYAYKAKLETEPQNEYYTRSDISKILGLSTVSVTKLVKNGLISKNIKKVNGVYRIPREDFEVFFNKQKVYEEQYISLEEAAQKINKSLTAVIQRVEKYFPNALKNNKGRWIVPHNDVQKYLEDINLTKFYNSNIALKELLLFINSCISEFKYKETLKLYNEFIRIQFNKMRGSTSYIRNQESIYKNLFIYLKQNLTNEIYLLKFNELEDLLNNSASRARKLLIPRFVNYSYSIKGIENDEKIVIDLSNRKKKETIYTPTIFNEIYLYVKNIDLQKKEALADQYHANMWAYTLLLLTDFIRGADLIFQIPNIDINDISIESLGDLKLTKLTLKESNLIINQLYLHFRSKRASKNGEFLTFIVSPDLIVPLAHALVISELHRRNNNDVLLLSTFVSSSKFQNVYTSGNRKHKKFFSKSTLPNDFKFHSQTMNRSVATYLFFSIMEDDSENADLALTLTQNSRSHLDSNSTAIYIQLTNKDGYINRVSINLFRRGYFGWLYNYLILAALEHENIKHSLEERTVAIEELRKKYTPTQTEKVAQLYLDYISTGDIEESLKEKTNGDYAEKITSIYSKYNSVIEKMKKYSKGKIIEIITKLAKNELPSKSEFGQCLIYPECEYPKAENCFKCEYFIPQYLILIELKQEINKIIDLIQLSQNEIMIRKYTSFLTYYLFLWKEARFAYGEELTSVYLSKDFIISKLENIAHKILIT